MVNEPLVSVLVISYNQEDYIEETLRSALDQDYDTLEVVVSDDGSSDRTTEIIEALAVEYGPRLMAITRQGNLGITGNINRALSACRGKYVATLGGDDVLLPGKVRTQVAWMEQHPTCAVGYHDADVFNGYTGESLYHFSEKRHATLEGDAAIWAEYGFFVCAVSMMFRRDAAPDVWFDSRLPVHSDWLFFLEVLVQSGGTINGTGEMHVRYRRNESNVTSGDASQSNAYAEQKLTMLAIADEKYPQLSKAIRRHRAGALAVHAAKRLLKGDLRSALTYGRQFVRQRSIKQPLDRLANLLTDKRRFRTLHQSVSEPR